MTWQTFHDTIYPILATIGGLLLAGGAVSAFALWLFKTFSEEWLSNQFAKRLELLRHEQQKELEELRFEINKLFDRATKLNQREFEVLPEAWSILTKGFYAANSLIAGLQSYPDITKMSSQQFQEFVDKCALSEWQKTEFKDAKDKNKYYQDAIFWHNLHEAKTAARKSAFYLLRNGIFMLPELKEKFDAIDRLAWEVILEHELNKQYEVFPREHAVRDKFVKDGENLVRALEGEVQNRLWGPTQAASNP